MKQPAQPRSDVQLVLCGCLQLRILPREGMWKTRITGGSQSRQGHKGSIDRRLLKLYVHFRIGLAARLAQKSVIEERFVTENIQPTDLEERGRKIGM